MQLQDDIRRVPASELENRLAKFRQHMDAVNPGWQMFATNYKITMYYFTGTIEDGVLIIRPEDAILWVRRSYERAVNESYFADIRPMHSLREAASYYAAMPATLYVESKHITLDWLQFIRKYFTFSDTASVDGIMQDLRAIKSAYELEQMRISGRIHEEALDIIAPQLLKAGISETELGVAIYGAMLERGSHGICRFNQSIGDESLGICAFGKSGLIKSGFDGPGGCNGTCIAVQNIGRSARKLRENQLVYLDIPCGFDGYHSDKTSVYYFGDLQADVNGQKILDAHNYCLEVEQMALSLMQPGLPIEEVYLKTMAALGNPYGEALMGGGKFLGHSIGLVIDEAPALAKSFKQPFVENMTFALEPKVALPGIGMVGTENTYVITKNGPVSLTGKSHKLS